MTLRRRLLLLLLPSLALLLMAGALVDRWVATASTRDAYDRALASMAFAAVAYLQADGDVTPPQISVRATAFLHSVDGASARGTDGTDGTDGAAKAAAAGAPAAGATAASATPTRATAPQPPLDRRYLAVTRADGSLVFGNATLAALAPRAVLPAQGIFRTARLDGQSIRMVSVGLQADTGPLTVTLAETGGRRDRTQHVMLLGKLLVDFAQLDLTLLVIWLAVYFGLRPLETLREQAEAHSPRELRRFDERGVPGELRPVVASFNRVLEMLHEAASAQRRFIADAAHQLRTPVAGLSAQIELLRQDARAMGVSAELELLQRGAHTLAHTANQLLSLARAEPLTSMEGNGQPVSLDALVKELVERQVDRADRAGIDLGAEPAPARVSGDPWLLEDLLTNLIDNALKYTPRGGRVTVRSGVDEARAWLEVEDDGPGIPTPERARVRERFYRRAGSPGIGVGLGLAIVDEIARAHRARLLIAAGAQQRGARMRVQFDIPALT